MGKSGKMGSSKVYSIDVREASSSKTFSVEESSFENATSIVKKPFAESLKKSRAAYEKKLNASSRSLKQILLERTSAHSSYYLLYAVLGPLATFLLDYGAFVLWPMKNAFANPDTW